MLTAEERRALAGALATAIGFGLKQNYRRVDGEWWLFNGESAARALRPEEIEWHTERGHHPFVEGGIKQDDPRWWDDPK